MACSNCQLANSSFDFLFLLQEPIEYHCEHCKHVRKLVHDYANRGRQIYVDDLLNFLFGVGPIRMNNQIRHDPGLSVMYINGEDIIKEKVRGLSLVNTRHTGRSNINSVMGKILNEVVSGFKEMVSTNPLSYLIVLVAILEYNVYVSALSFRFLVEDDADVAENQDEFCKTLIGSMEFWRCYAPSEFFRHAFKEWESQFALDKLTLQTAIEITTKIHSEEQSLSSGPVDIWRLLGYVRAMADLMSKRNEASNKLIAEQEIVIGEECRIEVIRPGNFDEIYGNFEAGLFSSREFKTEEFDIDSEYMVVINNICQKHIGLTINQLEQLAKDILISFGHADYFIIGSFEYFTKLVNWSVELEDEVIRKFLKFMIPDMNQDSVIVNAGSESKNRPLRKCLIPIIGDLYITTVNMFMTAILGLINDLFSRRVAQISEGLEKDLNNFHKMQDIEFEKRVFKAIQDCVTVNVVHGISQKIKGLKGEGFVYLPGEIDLLAFYKGKLFVLECKNFPLKFTPQAISNEYQKLTSRNKNSIADKLKVKIESIKQNWGAVLQLLEIAPSSLETSEPIGVIVTNDFTLASVTGDTVYPIVSFDKLVPWLLQESEK